MAERAHGLPETTGAPVGAAVKGAAVTGAAVTGAAVTGAAVAGVAGRQAVNDVSKTSPMGHWIIYILS